MLPRSVYKNSRAITEAISQVERKTGADAKDTDVAKRMGVQLTQYHQMLNEVNAGKLVGIEDLGVAEDVITTDKNKLADTPYDELVQGSF